VACFLLVARSMMARTLLSLALASAAAVACSSPDGPLGAAGTLASSGGTAPEVGNDAGGDGGDEGLEDRGGVGSNEDQGLVDGGDGTAGGDGGPLGDGGTPTIMSPIARAYADPFVLHAGGAYHLYATNSRGKHFPHATSTDLSSWHLAAENDAMPTLPSWAAPEGITWAPGVLQVSATRFVLFFASKRAGSAPVGSKGQMCLGRAVATSAAGPFVDTHAAPLYCESSRWSLDPSPFADIDGTKYLVWRQDVDDPARTSTMNAVYVRKLTADGESFAPGSVANELLRRTNGSWEDPIIENPAMVVANGKRVLFYSGNLWRTADYAVGYAVCASAVGPCTKKSTAGPWLGSHPSIGMTGPGGEEVVRAMGGAVDLTASGDLLLTMHGWLGPSIAAAGAGKPGIRAPWFAHLSLAGAAPVVAWP
jgi:hypothetical protein